MLARIEEELGRGPDVSIITIVNVLIEYAASLRASDIHIDPLEGALRIRFRIDGVLQDIENLPKNIHAEVIARIKVLSGLRTDEHQAAQDGRLRYLSETSGPIDIRVSITPSYFGENVVLRLLSDTAEQFALDTLGFSPADRE